MTFSGKFSLLTLRVVLIFMYIEILRFKPSKIHENFRFDAKSINARQIETTKHLIHKLIKQTK